MAAECLLYRDRLLRRKRVHGSLKATTTTMSGLVILHFSVERPLDLDLVRDLDYVSVTAMADRNLRSGLKLGSERRACNQSNWTTASLHSPSLLLRSIPPSLLFRLLERRSILGQLRSVVLASFVLDTS